MNKQILFLIATLLIVLLSIPIFKKNCEGFINLEPGSFPETVDGPLLVNDYPLKQNMGVSKNTYETNYDYYPVFGSSYKQHTNNVRYWATPDDGMCAPAEMCGGLYSQKKINLPKTPAYIPFSSPQIRVNYYGSHKLVCPDNEQMNE